MTVGSAWLVRNVTRQLGCNSRGYLGQPAIRVRLIGRARDGRDKPHHGAVRAMPGERVPEQIPLDCEFIVNDSSALLKPVIHELALVAKLDQRAVDPQRNSLDRNARELALAEIAHLPAAARQARARRMYRIALALRVVPGDINVHGGAGAADIV